MSDKLPQPPRFEPVPEGLPDRNTVSRFYDSDSVHGSDVAKTLDLLDDLSAVKNPRHARAHFQWFYVGRPMDNPIEEMEDADFHHFPDGWPGDSWSLRQEVSPHVWITKGTAHLDDSGRWHGGCGVASHDLEAVKAQIETRVVQNHLNQRIDTMVDLMQKMEAGYYA